MPFNQDGLRNLATGMGGPNDPTRYFRISGITSQLTEQILDEHIRQFPILRKIVELMPDMMTARWGVPTFGGEEVPPDLPDRLKNKLGRLVGTAEFTELRGVASIFNWCQKIANLYGNSAALMLCDDTDNLELPIAYNKLKSVKGLHLFDRWDIHPDLAVTGKLNQFTHYILSGTSDLSGYSRIHKSRILWFRGTELNSGCLRGTQGCDDSVLQGILDSFYGYRSGVESLARMIQNSSQLKHGIDNLMDDLQEKGIEYENFVKERISLNQLMGSVYNTLLYDRQQEEVSFNERGNLADIKDAFDALINDMIAQTNYTQSQILGEFTGGILTAGSQAERDQINLFVLLQQRSKFNSQIIKLCETILRSKEFAIDPDRVLLDWQWHPFAAVTPAEQASLKSQYINIALTLNQIDPIVALSVVRSLLGGTEFNTEITLPPEIVEYLDRTIKQSAEQNQLNGL
jgi:hypothetical protein